MKLVLATLAVFFLGFLPCANAKIVHEERSLYRNIIVSEDGDLRCMRFVVHDKEPHNQSCIFLSDAKKLAFDYTKMIVAALLIKPEPKSILIVGLGGGTLPATFSQLLPQAQITSVEIDPAVVKSAKQYFAYTENQQIKTELFDARVFVKRAQREGKKWDLIVLDAFNGDYIPEHLMTKEFLQEVQSILGPGGLVVANTFSASRLYHHQSATYAAVFPQIRMLARNSGNRVLFAANTPFKFPDPEQTIQQWQEKLSVYGFDVKLLLALEQQYVWDKKARVLTDQYSPANILKHQ